MILGSSYWTAKPQGTALRVGVLLPVPCCPCFSYWFTIGEEQPQSHPKDLHWPQVRGKPTKATCLGVPDEGDADGQLALHAPGESFGQGAALVLQVEDPQDVVDLLRTLGGWVSLQLSDRGREG